MLFELAISPLDQLPRAIFTSEPGPTSVRYIVASPNHLVSNVMRTGSRGPPALIGASPDNVMRWFIALVSVLLDPLACALLLAATQEGVMNERTRIFERRDDR